MFANEKDLRAALADAGLSAPDVAAAVAASRPAVRLTMTDAEESELALGASKLGGCPDLPAGFSWPIRQPYPNAAAHAAEWRTQGPRMASSSEVAARIDEDNRRAAAAIESPIPMAHVAQLDFAAIAEVDSTDLDLPATGRLLLFYDLMEQPWGFDPAQRGGFAVIYDDSPRETLVRHQPPPSELGLPDWAASPPGRGLSFRSGLSMISRNIVGWERLPISPAGWEVLHDLDMEHLDSPEWACHQLGGWPDAVQGEMQTECALVTAGHLAGDPDAFTDPTTAHIRQQASEWTLLLQLASDEKRFVMWGDSGLIYLWIRTDDLRARRFDRAHLILQCF